MRTVDSNLPKHYARIEVPPKPPFGWFGVAIITVWRSIGRIPVLADICGVVVALGVGVTGIGEYAFALELLAVAALALTSKLWHSDSIPFLRFVGSCCIAIVLFISSAVVWDAKGDNPWSHLPHAWHRLMAARNTSDLPPKPLTPEPRFLHGFALQNQYQYRGGILVDGIRWNKDLREYIFTIMNDMPSGETSNFREHLYLPIPVLRIELL
jgi:hypothetical protein